MMDMTYWMDPREHRSSTSLYGMVEHIQHMMIDRCSNKVAITSQYRLQPMDKWEDYPIKVLDIALLIMVTLPTVSSFFSTCGCFLRDGRSSSGDLPPLSLAWGWPPGANGSLPTNGSASTTFGLKILRVQEKRGRTDHRSGPGRPAWADRPRPIPARFGRPFAPVGPQVIMHFAPSICMILKMSSSRPRWWFPVHEVRSFTLQSQGVFLRSALVLATIGSDFIKLMNMNKTP
jgi:hypothetical protein